MTYRYFKNFGFSRSIALLIAEHFIMIYVMNLPYRWWIYLKEVFSFNLMNDWWANRSFLIVHNLTFWVFASVPSMFFLTICLDFNGSWCEAVRAWFWSVWVTFGVEFSDKLDIFDGNYNWMESLRGNSVGCNSGTEMEAFECQSFPCISAKLTQARVLFIICFSWSLVSMDVSYLFLVHLWIYFQRLLI